MTTICSNCGKAFVSDFALSCCCGSFCDSSCLFEYHKKKECESDGEKQK